MAFYGALFGWEFAGPGPMGYSVARLRGRDVAGVGAPAGRRPGAAAGWNTYVYVRERRARPPSGSRSAGGAVLVEAFDVLPAGRLAILADPAGAAFGAWEPRERKGAQLVNEPGAWAMSHLETPDPDAAAAFYGAVFGWTTETFGEGAGAITMFRLPGYVGGEPQQPVSREVIATMAAMRDDGGAALERQLLGPRRRRDRREGRRARRPRRRGALRHADDQDRRARRPARRHVHHQQRPRLSKELRWPTSPSSTT